MAWIEVNTQAGQMPDCTIWPLGPDGIGALRLIQTTSYAISTAGGFLNVQPFTIAGNAHAQQCWHCKEQKYEIEFSAERKIVYINSGHLGLI